PKLRRRYCAIIRPYLSLLGRIVLRFRELSDPPAGVTIEFGPEAFEHRSSCFFDLKEQRRAVPAREQANRAKRPHASDNDHLEGYITERVAVEQAEPLWRQTLLVGGKHAFGVDAVPRVALSRKMVDQRRLVYDPRTSTLYEMREVVILFEPLARLGEDGMDCRRSARSSIFLISLHTSILLCQI